MNTKKLLAGAALVTLSAGLAPGQAMAVTGTGNISAIVVQPITISASTAMKFGSFSVASAGKITIDSSGAETGRTGSTDIPGGTIQAGVFNVTGDTRSMLVTIDTAATLNHAVTATKTMKVTGINFQCNTAKWAVTAAAATSATCSLGTSPGTITTGGTLNYIGTQTAGTYTGTYNIFVSYN